MTCPSAANSAAFDEQVGLGVEVAAEHRLLPGARASCPSALSSTVFSCSSSAAATRCPRASSTAAASPVARPASTTAGGGTRSGAAQHDEVRERPEDELAQELVPVPRLPCDAPADGWTEVDGALEREFVFETFPARSRS